MKHVTATEAKNRFGELLDDAGSEPVGISKNGRPFRVILDAAEFQRLVEASQAVDAPLQASLERSLKRWNKLYDALAR
jgi:prevent-host-death family protein